MSQNSQPFPHTFYAPDWGNNQVSKVSQPRLNFSRTSRVNHSEDLSHKPGILSDSPFSFDPSPSKSESSDSNYIPNMPPRKSNVSATSNAEDGAESTPAKSKDGLSIEDLTLPKSMIARLAKGVLPPNTQIHKDALLAMHKSTTVFCSYIASVANEIAQSGGKKTISPQDMMAALKDCEFEEFLPRLEAELKKYNETQCDKRNTYRRKVKEAEKVAAATKEGDELPTAGGIAVDPTDGSIPNGHAGTEAGVDDEDRPMKKFKAADGSAVLPEPDGMENDMDDEPDVDDHQADDEHEDEGDEEEEEEIEDDDAADDTEVLEDGHPDSFQVAANDVRDEALDDSGSDSD